MTAEVLVVGGGVAALEAALALRELAEDRAAVTVLAPDSDFVYRPPVVSAPFAGAGARRFALAELVADAGAKLIADGLAWVDAPGRTVHTVSGSELAYDELVLAMGASTYDRFPHAVTIEPARLDAQLHGIVQDIEGGFVHSVAFVIPDRMAWPLPIYELALMTAERAYETSARLKVTLVTPEDAPLAIFGDGASTAVAGLLRDAGVTVFTGAHAEVPERGHVVVGPGPHHLTVDRVIALPELMGPAIRGLPVGPHGFVPVDPFGRVRDVDHVHAAGDVTDGVVKHGGLAAQQADTVALSVAAALGAPVRPQPLRPEIHGVLMTGGKPRYLSARVSGRHGFSSVVSDTPTWSSPAKISARHLTPFLEQHESARVAV